MIKVNPQLEDDDTILTFEELDKEVPLSEYEQQRKALELVHCIVTCNNPNKTSYAGEIFSVSNAKLPEIKKYVQYGTPYHVPRAIFKAIKEKKMLLFRKVKGVDGNMKTVAYDAPEYSIQELPPLTPEELEAIKKKQLAEGLNGDVDAR